MFDDTAIDAESSRPGLDYFCAPTGAVLSQVRLCVMPLA